MKLSIVILAKNEEEAIGDCLESVKWANEVVLLDGGSTDETVEIAKKSGAKIKKQEGDNYSDWRNQGREEAKREWILYLDADERVTPLLRGEIQETIRKKDQGFAAFAIPRRNFLLGRELRHGGWYPDYQIRLFKKDKLKCWAGELHERPEVDGSVGKLENPMIHLQPDKIEPALKKSISWSGIEAKLLFEAGHPPVSWWRILRMGATTFLERLIKRQGFRDGVEGWIESIYQSFHTMFIYAKLWEKQE